MSGQQAQMAKGWCPTAYRPMQSGDGAIMRLKPPLARYSSTDLRLIDKLAQHFGNGEVEITSRANLQIRGLDDAGHAEALNRLQESGLVDRDRTRDDRNAILINPFWQEGDSNHRIACLLHQGLTAFPELPAKFGYGVDCGEERLLVEAAADIRIERSQEGDLLLRPDGTERGLAITEENLLAEIKKLLSWYLENGGACNNRGRMRQLVARCPLPPAYREGALPVAAAPRPPLGYGEPTHLALPFGALPAGLLGQLADHVEALRLTPWRSLVLEGMRPDPQLVQLISKEGDPLLRVSACRGKPLCPSALQPTRKLALKIAAHLGPEKQAHISGCAKGCAHPGPCDITLTAREQGFDIIYKGRAGDPADGFVADEAAALHLVKEFHDPQI